MAKDKSTKTESSSKKSSAGAGATAVQEVTANPRLVAAIIAAEGAKDAYKSALIALATIAQEEQLTRAEVIASYMEAKGCTKLTAESQYSRMKGIMSDPEVMEDLRSGKIDLKMAREKTKKTQTAPSEAKKKENLEKRFSTAVAKIVECSKEGGMDVASVLGAVRSALRKNGVK